MATVIERVRAGATLLDASVPGWAEKLDQEELDLGSCTDCLLGQLFGHFTAYGKLAIDYGAICSFGFDAESAPSEKEADLLVSNEEADASDARVDAEYLALKAAWLHEIALRLNSPAAEEARIEALPEDVGCVWGAL